MHGTIFASKKLKEIRTKNRLLSLFLYVLLCKICRIFCGALLLTYYQIITFFSGITVFISSIRIVNLKKFKILKRNNEMKKIPTVYVYTITIKTTFLLFLLIVYKLFRITSLQLIKKRSLLIDCFSLFFYLCVSMLLKTLN